MSAQERAGAAVQRPEMPMLRPYRLWFEHTRKCTDGCKSVTTAQDGCETGRDLWDAYRLARIGSVMSAQVPRHGPVASALASLDGARHQAYGVWLLHAQECAACRAADTPRNGCDTGRELWLTYRDAPIGGTSGTGRSAPDTTTGSASVSVT